MQLTRLLGLTAIATLSFPSPAEAQSIQDLSEARYRISTTETAGYTLFAGGASCAHLSPPTCPSGIVDFYDAGTDTWGASSLSLPRMFVGATTVGGRAFFAGGWQSHTGQATSVIDIYDSSLGAPDDPAAWSVANLTVPRGFVAAATLGDHAFFAGGSAFGKFSRVDLYDAGTDTWSTASLSQARTAISAVTVGQKVLFAGGLKVGGPSEVVDIYDATIGPPTDPAAWSTAALSTPRGGLVAGVSVDGKAIFAGGTEPGQVTSDVVDIYDDETGTWSVASLSQARRYVAATTSGNRAYFAGGDSIHTGAIAPVGAPSDVIDVYDAVTGLWSVETLSAPRVVGVAATIGDLVVFAGGADDLGTLATVDAIEVHIGSRYCSPAVANSTGAPAAITAVGSPLVADNDVNLVASIMPPHQFGFFLTSQAQGFTPNPGGSEGILCLSGSIGRFVGPGQILNTGDGGTFSLPLNLAALPTPSGPVAAVAGETWNFQAWYRDANPTQTSNFTDAVGLTLQ